LIALLLISLVLKISFRSRVWTSPPSLTLHSKVITLECRD
jgi:hypothetical protein